MIYFWQIFTVENESMYKKEDVIVSQLSNLEGIEFLYKSATRVRRGLFWGIQHKWTDVDIKINNYCVLFSLFMCSSTNYKYKHQCDSRSLVITQRSRSFVITLKNLRTIHSSRALQCCAVQRLNTVLLVGVSDHRLWSEFNRCRLSRGTGRRSRLSADIGREI